MKKLLFTITLSFIISSSFAQWEWQNPLPQGNGLGDVKFFNNQEGWTVGANGTIMHTTDGGITWEFQASGTTENLHEIFLYDNLTLWIIGSSGCILFTENGGNSWTSQLSGTHFYLKEICFTDSLKGWVLGYQSDGWSYISNILYTYDGGQNWNTIWNTVYNDTTISLLSIQFLNDTTGWGVGNIMVDSIPQSAILKTNDAGTTWEISPDLIFNFPACGFHDIYFSDFDNGWIVGGCQTGEVILHTADGGDTWVTQYNNSSINFNSVYFIDNETGWAVGGSFVAYPGFPSIVRTTNGGDTWQLATIPYYPNCSLSSIYFSDIDNGWAVGGIGLILKSDDGGLNWLPQSEGTTDIPLNDICFVDSLYGWATGSMYNRTILLHTQNGGNNWGEQDPTF